MSHWRFLAAPGRGSHPPTPGVGFGVLGADPPTPSWQASGWMLGLGVTLPHPRRVCGRGVLEGDAFWGAEEGGWVMLGGVGVWAGLGCREALPPSSLAHPTILLLLLLLSPVLNSVATATMSTTFQLPRDGLRRGGKRGAKGRGGGGGGGRGLHATRGETQQGTGDIALRSGLGVTLPRWVFSPLGPVWRAGAGASPVYAKGSGLGVLPWERGVRLQPPPAPSRWVGTPKIWCLSAAILLVPGPRRYPGCQ